jgi:dephospho-CoA kinase
LTLVAITGGLASGKSTVAQLFADLGAFVISSDSIARSFLTLEHPIGKQIVTRFGPSLAQGGEMDRSELANLIFKDPAKRRELEQLMHPAVLEEIAKQQAHAKKGQLVVVEVPLLFEAGFGDFFDYVVCVETPISVSRSRYIQAGGSPDEFDRREAAQLSRAEKANRADICIPNIGDPASLREEVKRLYRSLTQKNNDPRRDRSP